MCRCSYLFAVFATIASGTGCGFEGAGADDGPDPDPVPNPGGTSPRCKFDFIDVCGKTPSDALVFSQNQTIDTSVDGNCPLVIAQAAGAPELCVFYAKAITVNAGVTVRGVGSRALAFVSQGGLTIGGTLSVTSSAATNTQDESLGAGAEVATCPNFGRVVVADGQGGSGGAGGSAASSGGNGGNNIEGGGRQGGRPSATTTATNVLRGGCRGQAGGDNGTAATGGTGGPGGGALLLAAHGTISIATMGRVTAGGGAGRGAPAYAGGGGGGSGGMLVLEGATIANAGASTATGGGGGQGGYIINVVPFSGSRGDDGRPDGNRADGGGNGLEPGQGGDGSSDTTGNSGAPSYDGAGGGGGGAGWIVVRGTRSGAGMWVPTPST